MGWLHRRFSGVGAVTYGCPLCGEGDRYTHPTAGGVKGHITASTGGDHKGRNGSEWDDEELRVGGDGSDAQGGADGAEASGEADGGASTPPEPEGGCPECGGSESVPPASLLRSMGVDVGAVPQAREYDHACPSCTTAKELVAWNE